MKKKKTKKIGQFLGAHISWTTNPISLKFCMKGHVHVTATTSTTPTHPLISATLDITAMPVNAKHGKLSVMIRPEYKKPHASTANYGRVITMLISFLKRIKVHKWLVFSNPAQAIHLITVHKWLVFSNPAQAIHLIAKIVLLATYMLWKDGVLHVIKVGTGCLYMLRHLKED